MIKIQDKEAVMGGTAPLNLVTYRIASNAVQKIGEILENMYSSPTLAVLREYITNAIDSHTLSDTDKNIQVTLPSTENKALVIRDFGHGLTKEETETLLFGYGASGEEKTRSNDYTGGFGIGAKCGYTLSKTFTYTIWNGGMKRVWVNTKDDNDQSAAACVLEEPSDEDSGVEVSIPIVSNDTWTMQRALNVLVPFLPDNVSFTPSSRYIIPGKIKPMAEIGATLLINEEETPINIQLYSESKTSDGPFAVVPPPAILEGNMLLPLDKYKIEKEITEWIEKNNIGRENRDFVIKIIKYMVVVVPTGTLQLNPSRESVKLTGRTLKFIEALISLVVTNEFKEAMTQKLLRNDMSIYESIITCTIFLLPHTHIKREFYSHETGIMFDTPTPMTRVSVARRKRANGWLVRSSNSLTRNTLDTTYGIAYRRYGDSNKPSKILIPITDINRKEIETKLLTYAKRVVCTRYNQAVLDHRMTTELVFIDTTLDIENMSWVKDGTFGFVKPEDVVKDISTYLFPKPASRQYTRKGRIPSKLLKVITRQHLIPDTKANSRFFENVVINSVKDENKIIAVLSSGEFNVYLADNYLCAADLLSSIVKELDGNAVTWSPLLPRLYNTNYEAEVYALRSTDYDEKGKNKNDQQLSNYIATCFERDAKQKLIDIEYLLQLISFNSTVEKVLQDIISNPIYTTSTSAKLINKYGAHAKGLTEETKTRTSLWLNLLNTTRCLLNVRVDISYGPLTYGNDVLLFIAHTMKGMNLKSKPDKDGSHPTLTSWLLSDTPEMIKRYIDNSYERYNTNFQWFRPLGVCTDDVSLRTPKEHIIRTALDEIPFLVENQIEWLNQFERARLSGTPITRVTRDSVDSTKLVPDADNSTYTPTDWKQHPAYAAFIKSAIRTNKGKK